MTEERPKLPYSVPSNTYLEAFMAEVASKGYFPWLNKDFGYSKLTGKDVEVMHHRFKVLNMVMHHLDKLYKFRHGEFLVDNKGQNIMEDVDGKEEPIEITEKDLMEKYSCLRMLFGMNATTAVLNQSKGGWARELARTSKFIAQKDKVKRRFLGRGGENE